jgi:hypothetical protein
MSKRTSDILFILAWLVTMIVAVVITSPLSE